MKEHLDWLTGNVGTLILNHSSVKGQVPLHRNAWMVNMRSHSTYTYLPLNGIVGNTRDLRQRGRPTRHRARTGKKKERRVSEAKRISKSCLDNDPPSSLLLLGRKWDSVAAKLGRSQIYQRACLLAYEAKPPNVGLRKGAKDMNGFKQDIDVVRILL